MKLNNSIKLLLLALVAFAACDVSDLDFGRSSKSANTKYEPFNPAELATGLSFEENVSAFTAPMGTSPQKKWVKSAVNEDSEAKLLESWQNVKKLTGFDANGDYMMTWEMLDGDAELSIPAEIYEKYKDQIPARDPNPVVRGETRQGYHKAWRKNGDLAWQHAYDTKQFRLTPAELDSLKKMNNDTTGIRAKARATLAQYGENVIRLSNDLVAVQTVDSETKKSTKTIYHQSLNDYVRRMEYDARGKLETVTFRELAVQSGRVIVTNETVYSRVDLSQGVPAIKTTHVNRKNFKTINN